MRAWITLIAIIVFLPALSIAQWTDDDTEEAPEMVQPQKDSSKELSATEAQKMAIDIIRTEKEKEEQQKKALRSRVNRSGRIGLGMTFLGPGLGFGQKFDYYLTPDVNVGIGTGTTLTVPVQDKFMISYSFYGAARYHFFSNYKISPYLSGYGGYIASSTFNDVVDYAMQWGYPDRLPYGVNQLFFAPSMGVQALASSGFSLFVEFNYMLSENINSHWFGLGLQVYGQDSGR